MQYAVTILLSARIRKSEQSMLALKLQDGGIREEDGEEGESTCSDEGKSDAKGAPSTTAGNKKL